MAKEIILPEGFEVDKIENGKIILKEITPKYPKTWEECYIQIREGEYISTDSEVCSLAPLTNWDANPAQYNTLPVGYGKKILALCRLLVCREVYWNGWRPDWTDAQSIKYVIVHYKGRFDLEDAKGSWTLLAFPTRKMRDAFYTNFKDLIVEAEDLI